MYLNTLLATWDSTFDGEANDTIAQSVLKTCHFTSAREFYQQLPELVRVCHSAVQNGGKFMPTEDQYVDCLCTEWDSLYPGEANKELARSVIRSSTFKTESRFREQLQEMVSCCHSAVSD